MGPRQETAPPPDDVLMRFKEEEMLDDEANVDSELPKPPTTWAKDETLAFFEAAVATQDSRQDKLSEQLIEQINSKL